MRQRVKQCKTEVIVICLVVSADNILVVCVVLLADDILVVCVVLLVDDVLVSNVPVLPDDILVAFVERMVDRVVGWLPSSGMIVTVTDTFLLGTPLSVAMTVSTRVCGSKIATNDRISPVCLLIENCPVVIFSE